MGLAFSESWLLGRPVSMELVARSDRVCVAVIRLQDIDLFGVEGEVDVALIALGHRFGAITGKPGIRHRTPAEGAIKHQLHGCGLWVAVMIGYETEAQEMDLGEGLTGDPGDLGVKLCLGHALLLSVRSQSPRPRSRRTGSRESAKQDREW